MNQEETIVQWKKCEDLRGAALAEGKNAEEAHKIATALWNTWANDLLARKAVMENAGTWAVEEKEVMSPRRVNNIYGGFRPKNDATRCWMEESAADFSVLCFVKEVGAGETHYEDKPAGQLTPLKLDLKRNSAVAVTRFEGWIFPGTALFNEVEFSGAAWFTGTQFYGAALFDGARFSMAAWFDNAEFLNRYSSAKFRQTRFEAHANFEKVVFRAGADFTAIRSEATFNLANATFYMLPSFIQANFKEAPRLDNIMLGSEVAPGGFWRSLFVRSTKDVSSKYRALKRLAIQGHDHEREYQFFRGELRSRRTSEDKWWYSRYWIGILYDLVSDFGRSVWRPVLVWFLWTAALAELYAISATSPAAARCSQPFWEGLYLAVRNGFPLSGSKDQRIVDGYSCLYKVSLVSGNALEIPVWISYAELLHALGSVVLIFLTALALRNQFRIR
jgi:hypothetical protein